MNTSFRRSLLTAWAVILLLTVSLLTLAACGEEKGETPISDPAAETTAEQSVPEEETEPEILPDLPDDLNYNGETFTFLSRGDGWAVKDIYVEEDSGDTVTAAVYQRNMALYDELGIEIKEVMIPEPSIATYLYNSVAANEQAFDAVDMHPMAQFQSAFQGILLDLEQDVPYLELDKPWWDASTRRDFAVNGHLYYIVSDINLMANKATWVAVFNKNMLEDLGYGQNYVYDCVRDGTWTLDAYYDLTKGLVRDLNNDNKMNSVDQYGTAYQTSGPDGFLLCAGFRYTEQDPDDGSIVFRELDDRSLDILNKVMKICQKSYNSHLTTQNESYNTDSENGRTMFTEGRCLFFTETLDAVDSFRDMEDNYGIVPLPKYSEEDDYTTYINYWAGSSLSVPITAPNLEKTGRVLDYMSYLSKKIVTPAYFNRVVEGKYSRDADSYEMLTDYIMKNRVFDVMMANRYAGLPDTVDSLLNKGQPAFSSTYARSVKSINVKIDELNDAFSD